MNLNKLTRSFAAAVFMSAFSSAQAVSLSLVSSTPSVTIGDTIELQVLMDFSDDPTVGGGFDIIFDDDPSDSRKLVSYVSETYLTDTTLGSDPDLTRDDNPAVLDPANRVDVETDRLAGAAFGDFGGLAGPATVGTLSFIADAAGAAVFSLDASTSDAVGGFFSAGSFDEQFPDFNGTTVTVVPIPAALWLFGSGLVGLIGIARCRGAA
jgi:hypothetical protein